MTSPRREVDDDFVEYVRARQHQLLRAAFLVCGDERLAEQVTESAFGALLLRWRRVKDDDPDLFVRRALYRAAISRRVPARDRGAGSTDLPELAALTRRQRAVAVLLRHEQRGESEAAEVLGTSVGALRHQLPATSADVLTDAAAPILERDFVDRARDGARDVRRRSRRTWLGWLAGVATLVGAAAFLPGGPGGSVGPAPTTPGTPSQQPGVSGAWDPTPFAVLGTRAQVGPSPAQLPGLPPIDDLTRGQLALPELLSFGPDTVMRRLSDVGASSAPVRAVLLRRTTDGFRAVLVRPTLSDPFMLVDTVPLVQTVDEGGNVSSPLGVRAVADDRRRVMFVQPGKVVVLDAFSGEVRTVTVPDRYLTQGGWAPDGESLIVWSETFRWRVTPSTGAVHDVRRSTYSVHPGRFEVQVRPPSLMRVLGFDEHGAGTSSQSGPDVLSGVWGATFSHLGTRYATGGFLSDGAVAAAGARSDGAFQGILAATADRSVTPRLLISPGGDGSSVGCCEVLGWAYRDRVLVRWDTTELLSWDTATGELLRVATLPGLEAPGPPGSPADSVALAP